MKNLYRLYCVKYSTYFCDQKTFINTIKTDERNFSWVRIHRMTLNQDLTRVKIHRTMEGQYFRGKSLKHKVHLHDELVVNV